MPVPFVLPAARIDGLARAKRDGIGMGRNPVRDDLAARRQNGPYSIRLSTPSFLIAP